MSIFMILGSLILALLGGVAWIVLKSVSIVFYVLSFIIAAASVLIGGIGKFVGTILFVLAVILLLINGFSINILAMFGITIVLVTSRMWLEKLAFLCSDISAAL